MALKESGMYFFLIQFGDWMPIGVFANGPDEALRKLERNYFREKYPITSIVCDENYPTQGCMG